MLNKFELQGRVGFIDIVYKDNDKGTVYTTVNLGIKKNESGNSNDEKNWDNVFITFFNTEKRKTAEILAEKVKKGDYIRVVGKISENRYTPEGSDKEKSEVKLIGFGFKKQEYDEMQLEWVDID